MDVRTYRAATMQEALSLVRQDLGPEAAVLQTRELPSARWLGWLPGYKRIEVTASAEVRVPSRLPTRREAEPTPAERLRDTQVAELRRAADRGPQSPVAVAQDDVRGQLRELQSLVEDLCRRTRPGQQADLPESLFRLYTDMLDAEVSEELARELVERVRRESGGETHDPLLLKAHVARLVEEELRVQGPLKLAAGRTHLVALVGPTGVGKTTTIAKLAANYRLREKKRVGLITVDTYRIAAVEQLRTYADIIDLPMRVVNAPHEIRDAIRSLAGLDLILMDTAGRSPRDEVKIQELRTFLAEAQADEVHLVLSSVAGTGTLVKTAEQFASVGTTALVLTKLDEATGLGSVLPLLRSSQLPLSYLTHGQNVPDDIVAADRRRLARMILGMEQAVAERFGAAA